MRLDVLFVWEKLVKREANGHLFYACFVCVFFCVSNHTVRRARIEKLKCPPHAIACSIGS